MKKIFNLTLGILLLLFSAMQLEAQCDIQTTQGGTTLQDGQWVGGGQSFTNCLGAAGQITKVCFSGGSNPNQVRITDNDTPASPVILYDNTSPSFSNEGSFKCHTLLTPVDIEDGEINGVMYNSNPGPNWNFNNNNYADGKIFLNSNGSWSATTTWDLYTKITIEPLPPPICGTANWTGAAGDGDWANAANWDINQVPSDCSDVRIADGSAVNIPAGTFEAKTIWLGILNTFTAATGNASSLTIASGGALDLANSSIDRTFVLFGGTSLTNNGTFNITESGKDALVMWGELTNNVGATLNISNSVRNNLVTGGVEGVFHNDGTINVSGGVGGPAVQNNATFNNNLSGLINTSGCSAGIGSDGYFNNYGTILIDNPLHRGIGINGCGVCHFNNFSTNSF